MQTGYLFFCLYIKKDLYGIMLTLREIIISPIRYRIELDLMRKLHR